MAPPDSDYYVTRKGILAILGLESYNGIPRLLDQPTFPKQARKGQWRRREVEEWASTPRCSWGEERNRCWQPRDDYDPYQLKMCPKHRKQGEEILQRQENHYLRKDFLNGNG